MSALIISGYKSLSGAVIRSPYTDTGMTGMCSLTNYGNDIVPASVFGYVNLK